MDIRDDPVIALSDFGLGQPVSNTGPPLTACCGTMGYVAPELVAEHKEECQEVVEIFASCQNGYGKEADAWSLCIALFYLLTKKLPYTNGNPVDYIIAIFSNVVNFSNTNRPVLSESAKNLICGLLTIDSTRRCIIDAALQSEWLGTAPKKEDGI
ncbi:kinase-like domain-containing protein [Syncephalis fuscata]|nr:kinase-like domain-containing protein [Syncephalis fuscata]